MTATVTNHQKPDAGYWLSSVWALGKNFQVLHGFPGSMAICAVGEGEAARGGSGEDAEGWGHSGPEGANCSSSCARSL